MTLWFILALMTAAAIFAVLWPLGRPAKVDGANDIAVYRAQLAEVEADRAAARISESEAQAARTEISRRLIAAADAKPAAVAPAGDPAVWRRAIALVALIAVPVIAAGLYSVLGSPRLPGKPFAERNAATEQESIEQIVARVEAHLATHPDDARGWQLLAPVYMKLGRFDDAIKARENALRILGSNAQRESDLGEALTAAAGGVVSPDAKGAFERALAGNPNDYRARFYLGLAAEQAGKPEEASIIWRELLAIAPPDAAWVDAVRQSLARVGGGGETAPGPTEKDIAAANQLTPEQRNQMIQGMVAKLAERLKSNGSDVEGWMRLLNSYVKLGEKEKARAAAEDARRALASEPEKLRRVNELIKGLGLES
jgi:cytochrome c-type biogenesis protein CcmH